MMIVVMAVMAVSAGAVVMSRVTSVMMSSMTAVAAAVHVTCIMLLVMSMMTVMKAIVVAAKVAATEVVVMCRAPYLVMVLSWFHVLMPPSPRLSTVAS